MQPKKSVKRKLEGHKSMLDFMSIPKKQKTNTVDLESVDRISIIWLIKTSENASGTTHPSYVLFFLNNKQQCTRFFSKCCVWFETWFSTWTIFTCTLFLAGKSYFWRENRHLLVSRVHGIQKITILYRYFLKS
jgi:hypothetical protein